MPEQDLKFGKYPKNALIEDVAKDFLDEIKMGYHLEFLEFLKQNKLTPRRASSANWVVKHKGKYICNLKLNVEEPFWSPALTNCTIKDWKLTLAHSALIDLCSDFEKNFADDELKEFIKSKIQKPKCPRNCQNKLTVFGKEFFPVCYCEPFSAISPSGAELEHLKNLIQLIKTRIADVSAASKI